MQRNAVRLCSYSLNPGVAQVFEASQIGDVEKLQNILKQIQAHEINTALETMAMPMESSFCGTPVAFAAANGHMDVLRCLVENGGDINSRRLVRIYSDDHKCDKCTPLMIASEKGHINVVKFLIGQGAYTDLQNTEGETALHFVVRAKGDSVGISRRLIENGADVNARTHNKHTPLMLASSNDDINLVNFLLKNGANVNLEDDQGRSALHYAVRDSYHDTCDVVRCLISAGANVNARTKCLSSPLMKASEMNSINIVNFLIEKGANINYQNKEGLTALHYALTCYRGNFVNNISEVAHKLLTLGASANLYSNQRLTPLLYVCNRCEISVVENLVLRPEYTTKDRIDALELLGASLATCLPLRDYDVLEVGYEYMKRAMEARFEDDSKYLLKQPVEADEDYQNWRESETMEELAQIEGSTDAIILEGLVIRERILGKENTALLEPLRIVAQYYGNLCDLYLPTCIGLYKRVIKIAHRCSDSARDEIDKLTSLLYKMVRSNGYPKLNDLVTLLEHSILEYEMEKKHITELTSEKKPLKQLIDAHRSHLSNSLHCLIKLVQITKCYEYGKTSRRLSALLQRLVQMNPRDDHGNNLLHKAVGNLVSAEILCIDTVKFFLNAGVSVNAVNNNGDTPLHRAVISKPNNRAELLHLSDMLTVLLDEGAHHDFVNNFGKTAMDLATSDEARRILSEKRNLELKCISARAVKNFGLPYMGVVPKTLERYISMH